MLKQLVRAILGKRSRTSPSDGDSERAFGAAIALAESERTRGHLAAAERHYEAALLLAPPAALAARVLAQLAAVHHQAGLPHRAAACYERALAADPDFAEVHYNYGLLLCEMGRIPDAEAHVGRAVALRPGFAEAQSSLLGLQGLYRHDDPERVCAAHVAWASVHADPLTQAAAPHANTLDPARPLRIGYVSGDFREHSMSYFIDPILSNHDREQFRIFCYDNWPGQDEVNARLRRHVDAWRKIDAMNDEDAAALVRADGIDILVDLSGHTTMNRLMLFARKPAPVQATWLGYMCTTGMAAIDYRITDPYLDPPGATEKHYREHLLRIPSAAAFSPSPDSPDITPLPALARGHVTFGSFNNYAKVTDEAASAWASILGLVAGSRLLLIATGGDNADTRREIEERFSRLGAPAGSLSVLGRRPMRTFLETVAQADLALDPFPSSGGTTSLHTLWMGVPIVTLEGATELSRSTAGMLRSAGLGRFAAADVQEYARIAVETAGNIHVLADLRANLRSQMRKSAIHDAGAVARSLEAAFREMWLRHVEKSAPARNQQAS